MKKIKYLIIGLIVLLSSGCTIDYNIEFKSDHTLDENIIITEDTSKLEETEYSVSDIVDSKISSYNDEITKNSFKVTSVIKEDNVSVTLNSKNKDVSRFINLVYFRKMFVGANVDETKEVYKFKTNGDYNQSGVFYDTMGISDEGFVDQININIKFEDKVISSNADKVDEEKNIYTWVLNKDTKEKSIEFELVNTNHKTEKKTTKKSNNNRVKIIVCLIGIVLLVLLLGYIKYTKGNKV